VYLLSVNTADVDLSIATTFKKIWFSNDNKVTDFIATWNATQKYTDPRDLKDDVKLMKRIFQQLRIIA